MNGPKLQIHVGNLAQDPSVYYFVVEIDVDVEVGFKALSALPADLINNYD